MSVWTVVVAAGSGARFGGAKQLERLGDRRVLDWSLAAAEQASDGVVLVVADEHRAEIEATLGCSRSRPLVVTGGATRSASVRCGLAAVPATADFVLVHDAARPLASPELFARVLDAVRAGADAAVPGVPLVDTIRQLGGGVVPRDELVAVQTPQAFRAAVLRAAHRGEPDATDDASLVETAGGKVVVVPGDPVNRKITTPSDLVIARALVGEAEGGLSR